MNQYAIVSAAEKIISIAETVPVAQQAGGNLPKVVREKAVALEDIISAGIAYALPLPPGLVDSPKVFYGTNFGKLTSTLLSTIGEKRMLNPEVMAVNIQHAWLYRYAIAHDIGFLQRNGRIDEIAVAGVNCIWRYSDGGGDSTSYNIFFSALEQISKFVSDVNAILSEGNDNDVGA